MAGGRVIGGDVDGRIGEALRYGIDANIPWGLTPLATLMAIRPIRSIRSIRSIEVLIDVGEAIEPLMVCGILGIN